MPAQEHRIYPPGEDSHWGSPIRDTVSARTSPAENVLFWCNIGHYSYDKIADHSGGSAHDFDRPVLRTERMSDAAILRRLSAEYRRVRSCCAAPPRQY
jgi:hypothetical protein